jgi:ABC-type dipeptide/oligopeptide/nickel transport system permease subunit
LSLRLGLALVGGVILFAMVGPALDAHDPLRKNLPAGLTELGEPRPPSREYPLGTDHFGRCVTARVAAGARLSLGIGVGAAVLALLVGTLIGMIAGFAGGVIDGVLMRMTDLVLAFPFVLIVIALGAGLRGRASGAPLVLLVLVIAGWTQSARLIRGRTRVVRELPFVEAARASGATTARILFRHVLPQLLPTALALASLSVAALILAEAGLSYLGLGAPPPAASWGRMLEEAQPYLASAPWLAVAPGIALVATVLGFHLLGEGVRK